MSLPAIPEESGEVKFVHRGSHVGDAGSVPPALQEVLINMRRRMSEPFPAAEALQYLQRRRKNRGISLAAFLHKVIARAGTRKTHGSLAGILTSYLTGVNVFTVEKFANPRPRADAEAEDGGEGTRVRIPKGGGGRPGRREGIAPSTDTLPSVEVDSDSDDLNVEAGPIVPPPASDRVADLGQGISRPPLHQVGLRVGSLVAPLCHSCVVGVRCLYLVSG